MRVKALTVVFLVCMYFIFLGYLTMSFNLLVFPIELTVITPELSRFYLKTMYLHEDKGEPKGLHKV